MDKGLWQFLLSEDMKKHSLPEVDTAKLKRNCNGIRLNSTLGGPLKAMPAITIAPFFRAFLNKVSNFPVEQAGFRVFPYGRNDDFLWVLVSHTLLLDSQLGLQTPFYYLNHQNTYTALSYLKKDFS